MTPALPIALHGSPHSRDPGAQEARGPDDQVRPSDLRMGPSNARRAGSKTNVRSDGGEGAECSGFGMAFSISGFLVSRDEAVRR